MLIANLKSLHSPDILDLKNFYLDADENFSFLLEIGVGIKDKEGEEYFYMEVCTEAFLLSLDKPAMINNFLVLKNYDYNQLDSYIKNKINIISGQTWEDIVQKIKEFATWEYDDYQP